MAHAAEGADVVNATDLAHATEVAHACGLRLNESIGSTADGGRPCIGKASDRGDIGCRFTPEMIEMIQKALELRAQGIIKF